MLPRLLELVELRWKDRGKAEELVYLADGEVVVSFPVVSSQVWLGLDHVQSLAVANVERRASVLDAKQRAAGALRCA